MSDIILSPSKLIGTVSAPSSKSVAHRALICAALAGAGSVVSGIGNSKDVSVTLECLRTLGVDISVDGDSVSFGDRVHMQGKQILDCYESGSTLRFMIPIVAALGIEAQFIGRGRLPERPISEYSQIMQDKGIHIELNNGCLPLNIRGQLTSGTFELRGDISSQYVTGLLLALPLLEGDSEIILTSPLESAPYVAITIDVMTIFGANVSRTTNGYKVKGGTGYTPANYRVEGDYSQAAFWLSAGAIGGDVTVTNLNPDTSQGDKEIISILQRFGANIECKADTVRARAGVLKGIDIDASQIPDLVPILAVVASYSEGKTYIYNCARLRLKECDRLEAVADCLNKLGGKVEHSADSLTIYGANLSGATISDWNDHRIVMAMAIASLNTKGNVTIQGRESIRKSYPHFFEDYVALGGITDGLDLG